MIRRFFLFAIVVIVAVVAYEWITFPDVSHLEKAFPKTTAFMEIRRAQLREAGKSDTLSYTPVPYSSISPYLRRAVLVAEDNNFYEHAGIDQEAMREALRRDWQRGKITHGGSTITQQLAKNLYLSPSRNPLRKIEEYFIARSLERHLTKKRILELYLNVVEMGEHVYGAAAAAQFYFHKPASVLTPNEAALLAGCLPNPRVMSPAVPNKRLRARQRMILSRLKRWGYLAEEAVMKEKQEAPLPATQTAPDTVLEQTPPSDSASPQPTETTITETSATGTLPATTSSQNTLSPP